MGKWAISFKFQRDELMLPEYPILCLRVPVTSEDDTEWWVSPCFAPQTLDWNEGCPDKSMFCLLCHLLTCPALPRAAVAILTTFSNNWLLAWGCLGGSSWEVTLIAPAGLGLGEKPRSVPGASLGSAGGSPPGEAEPSSVIRGPKALKWFQSFSLMLRLHLEERQFIYYQIEFW